MKVFSIILILSIILSLFAKTPHMNGHFHPHYKNYSYDYDKYSNSYNDYYNDYNTYERNIPCTGSLIIGSALFSLWLAILILYFMVNRKKKPFKVMINSQPNNLSGYMNV